MIGGRVILVTEVGGEVPLQVDLLAVGHGVDLCGLESHVAALGVGPGHGLRRVEGVDGRDRNV